MAMTCKLPTIRKIIDLFGGLDWLKQDGNYIRLENKPYMRLVIEYIGDAPKGPESPLISVAHYGEQNGDVMRDPDVVFLVDFASNTWLPVSFRNDYVGVYQEIVTFGDDGKAKVYEKRAVSCSSFARMWDKNIKEQGFIDVATKLAAAPASMTADD